MNLRIIVLAKQVPDTRNVGKDAMTAEGTVNRAALPAIFNPEDLNALEQALRLKEQNPGSTVGILTMGPPRAAEIIRQGLYRGADTGWLLSDRLFAGADTLATSYALFVFPNAFAPAGINGLATIVQYLFHLNIGYYNKTTWVDADAAGLAGIKEQWGIVPAKTIAYVNGENYLAYSGLTGEVSYEYYHKDGEVLYGQAGTYNHDTKAYTVTNADTQLGIDSIWLPGIQIDGYMAPITVADFTPEALKAISYQSVEGENASATSPGDQGHLTLLTMALIPSIGYGTSAMFSTLYSTANAQMKFYDFFNNTTVKVTADTIELETSISGLGYDSKGELLDAYMGIKISAIGSTTVPTVTTGTAAEVGE